MEFLTLSAALGMSQFSGVGTAELDNALSAANGWVSVRVYDYSLDPVDEFGAVPWGPPELTQAVVLLTARYLARANSVEGLVGMGDQVAYLPSEDRDVAALIRPYRRAVIG